MSQMKRAKNHFSAQRSQPVRALWLLACMVPYLFFALLGEGLHTNHFAYGLERVAATGAAHVSHGQSHYVDAEKRHHGESEADCFACQWAANSTAFLAFFQPLSTPTAEVASNPDAVATRWTSRSIPSPLGRGPPTI